MEINLQNTVLKYFTDLTGHQIQQFALLEKLYREWNEKVNVISRKDIDSLYLHHVLHSLSIAKFINFKPGSHFLDVGTGGGFPGIPLAIMFPQCKFLLIDGKAKKIKVVQAIVDELDLKNCICQNKRSEELKLKFDFVLARAVTRLDKLIPMCEHLISETHINPVPNGLIALKGGDIAKEIKEIDNNYYSNKIPIAKMFDQEYFNEKYILYIQL